MKNYFEKSKKVAKSGKILSGLSCKMTLKPERRRMKLFGRRKQIIERMRFRITDTAGTLAHEFSVTERTIRNDVQELSVSGYPIVAEPGRGGGIKWLGGKRRFLFSERETLALKNAIALASQEDKPILENLLCERLETEIEIKSSDLSKLLTGGKSQRELAKELGISKSYISRLLFGERKPGAKLAERILKLREGLLRK